MQAVLVFIDGTVADTRPRHSLKGTPDFYKREELLKDIPVPDSVRCLRELTQRYKLVYLGARPAAAQAATEEWLRAKGFPNGPVYLGPTQEDRLALAKDLKTKFDFAAGVGVRWDDNELHLELGCLSIILKEFEGNWDTVRRRLLGTEHTALQTATDLLAAWAKSVTEPEPHRMDVMLSVADLLPAVRALHDARWGYLSAITGVDHPPAAAGNGSGDSAGSIEALYHFCRGAAVVTLRVSLPRDDASLPSLCGIVPSAGFFERELSEMFGVNVIDLPDRSRLFLPDDWPEGVHPLRKDFVVAETQTLTREA